MIELEMEGVVKMLSNDKKLIAVIGATGQQGGGVVRALQANGQFAVRALTRNPDKHRELAEEVVEADLGKPETLKAAFEGAYGVFLVTNFQEAGSNELSDIVAGAFAHPDQAGNGQYLPLVGDFMSFNEIVETLNRQGHNFSYNQVPKESFAGAFPGAAEIAEMFSYWEAHTYLGLDSTDRIALANKIAGREPTRFSTWARENFPK